MDLHPILVHFPIAFLTLYSLMEPIRFRKVLALPYWFYVKATVLIIGALATLPTILAGDIASEKIVQQKELIFIHEIFAITTSTVFLFLAVLYFYAWLKRAGLGYRLQVSSFAPVRWVWGFLNRIEPLVIESNFVIAIALYGFILLLITGELGGALVYGPRFSQITSWLGLVKK